MSKFQLILIGLFGAFVFFGVLIFALGKFGSGKNMVPITVWGFMSFADFSQIIEPAGLKENETVQVNYVQVPEATFDADFIEALASGTGPDLFFLAHDAILKHADKIYPIPFESVSERNFKEAFVEEGELYLTSAGALGIPFIIDPMVMYWNRDTFSSAGLSQPPKFWSEFYDLAPRLNVKDGALNITKSTVALGEYGNVSHASDIVSLLVMQAGGAMSARGQTGMTSSLLNQFNTPVIPATLALSFYTEFTNPLKPFYSWNRSLPTSKNYFIRGDLATYFGYASELEEIANKNPNLNFDVAKIPQSSQSPQVITFGKMYALAIPKASQKKSSAIAAAILLVGNQSLSKLSEITHLPPVRRDMLAQRPADKYLSVFYEAAIQARAWLAPDKTQTNAMFKEMIESVTGGRRTVNDSINRSDSELNLLFSNTR